MPYSGDSVGIATKLKYKVNLHVTTIQTGEACHISVHKSITSTKTRIFDELSIWCLFFVNLRYKKNDTNSECSEHNKACNT